MDTQQNPQKESSVSGTDYREEKIGQKHEQYAGRQPMLADLFFEALNELSDETRGKFMELREGQILIKLPLALKTLGDYGYRFSYPEVMADLIDHPAFLGNHISYYTGYLGETASRKSKVWSFAAASLQSTGIDKIQARPVQGTRKEKDGTELLRIKAELARVRLAVLRLTEKIDSLTEPKTPEEVKTAGVVTIIHEPITEEELLAKTNETLTVSDGCEDRNRAPVFNFFLLGR